MSNDKEIDSLNLDFSNLDIFSKGNLKEMNDKQEDDINLSKIDNEDSNDLYMPYEKSEISNNKGDIIEELVNEITVNKKNGDDENKNEINFKNILIQNNTIFSTKFTTYNNETLSNKEKGKTFINKKTKRK